MTSDDSPAALQQRLENLEEQLRQAQKMSTIGAIASSTTHEFNNILTTVINYAKMGPVSYTHLTLPTSDLV